MPTCLHGVAREGCTFCDHPRNSGHPFVADDPSVKALEVRLEYLRKAVESDYGFLKATLERALDRLEGAYGQIAALSLRLDRAADVVDGLGAGITELERAVALRAAAPASPARTRRTPTRGRRSRAGTSSSAKKRPRPKRAPRR